MSEIKRPIRCKYSTDELMAMVDLFNVSPQGQEEIREILQKEPSPPTSPLFRYYNPQSRVEQFEKQFSEKMNSKYVLAVNSGTSALIAALVAAGVGPGDEVIVPAYTFFASVSAIVVAKAIPVITEIDESLTLDVEAIKKNITSRTKAIMVVHMVGHAARMDAICDIAKKYNLRVIEDVAQACGGKYKDRFLGTWGDLGCISLDAYKVIGTGEGGLITTNDEWLYTRAQSYHDTAACWRPDRFGSERKPGELFCGENYRLSEMAGAIGLVQLKKLDWINDSTRKIYFQLRDEIKLPPCAKWITPNDLDGVCGYTLGILFDSAGNARKGCDLNENFGSLSGRAMAGARDWHVYWYWEHVLEQKTATQEGCPFKCPMVKNLPKYSVDMCPRTKDIMLRTVFMSIQPTDTSEWASQFAAEINKSFTKAF